MPNQEPACAWNSGIGKAKILKSAKILNSGFWKAKILKSAKIWNLGFWAILSVLEKFRPPFLLTRLTAPGSSSTGVLNQPNLIHRCLLYEESMKCGPPCHISGCKKVQFYHLSLVYLYRLKDNLINIDVSHQLSSRHF